MNKKFRPEPGVYLKHKHLGWVGYFRCHDRRFGGGCLVTFQYGEDREINVSTHINSRVIFMDYAPTLTWQGSYSRLIEEFEMVGNNYEI